MNRKETRLEKYLGNLIIIGIIVFFAVDFINYLIIFKDYGVDSSIITSKNLSGTTKNKHWDVTYEYHVDDSIYKERVFDFTPFSNTYKRNTPLYIYYFNKKPSKHIVVCSKLRSDFSPSLIHYLTLDRNTVFYIKCLLFLVFVKLIPLLWALIYTVVGVVLIKIFRPIKYKRFMTSRKEKLYKESIGRIINKVERIRY